MASCSLPLLLHGPAASYKPIAMHRLACRIRASHNFGAFHFLNGVRLRLRNRQTYSLTVYRNRLPLLGIYGPRSLESLQSARFEVTVSDFKRLLLSLAIAC
eukprot:1184525-Prorocentrum_minimum.AAC.3